MKKLSLLLAVAMALSMLALPALAESSYAQSPMLDEAVASGALASVADRLPETPKLAKEILDEYLDYEIGNYGGTMRFVTSVVNWDADVFIGMNEGILSMSSTNSGEILPNVVGAYEANEDQTAFTFTLRSGLKWSDGTEVTMDDVRFTIENCIFNEELTPTIAAYMRDGGSTEGDPFIFEVIDDTTFSLSFKTPYGGFLVHMSAAGWKGYTEMIKPAHYLKPFHAAYAEEVHGSLDAFYAFMQPFATAIGYDDVTEEGIWCYVFNQMDMTNWELTDPTDALTAVTFEGLIDQNFPHLYPWIMVHSDNGVTTWERNPYYFKVDADGNQLPYIDTVTSTLTEDMEMVQMRYISGDADFARESATIDNITLYKENEANSGLTAYVTSSHVNPYCIYLNMNFGLNTDGSPKDDDYSRAWQEVVTNPRFLEAVEMAIDAEEVLETVYRGFGTVNARHNCIGDFDAANAILDEIGMIDIDGDGYRETPSGLPFYYQVWNSAETSDMTPNCELLVEYFSQIGLRLGVAATDQTMLRTSWAANEVPLNIFWNGSEGLWYEIGWSNGVWGPLWGVWYNNSGLTNADAPGLVPPENVQNFFREMDLTYQVSPELGATEVYESLANQLADMNCAIMPLTQVQQCVLVNSDIGNVPTGGIGIGWNYSIEQMFYRSFSY
ncbi:MAG: ABC transporter substrate-binding protein [Christensenellales bacterium]|jgi:peptide/nickel transport system substrate-binding protein